MDSAVKTRIDLAWREARDWIVEFDGSPTIALLVDAPPEKIEPGLRALAAQAENFRLTVIAAGLPDGAEFIPLESFPGYFNSLREGALEELSANFAVRREAFDLDVHVVLYPLRNGNLSLELVWWSDQVFSEETDNAAQFAALMDYFIELQQLFSAAHLYISPESGLKAGEELEGWVEV